MRDFNRFIYIFILQQTLFIVNITIFIQPDASDKKYLLLCSVITKQTSKHS